MKRKETIKMKKTIITAIITTVAVAAITVSALAAARDTTIQAILSPGITIKYNGEPRTMKDANGDVVYPLLYNGTTYLPVRAVSEMLGLPVNWVNETRTVELGKSNQPKSLLDATDAGVKGSTSSMGKWEKVLNKDELPFSRDDYGNKTAQHTEAIKASAYYNWQTKTVFALDRKYSTLGFTAYNCSEYTAAVQITDNATKAVLWSDTLEPGTSIFVSDVNISRTTEVEFSDSLQNAPVSAGLYYDVVYICDPLVY
jgi:hypothetical protein